MPNSLAILNDTFEAPSRGRAIGIWAFFGSWARRLGARPLLMLGCLANAGGLFMFLRVPAGPSYWSGLLPALLAIGIGSAAAVAPLTTAVMASVEPRLSGTASGFNDAVARTGGLIAMACLGQVMAATGPELVQACHTAAAVAAVACILAAASGLIVAKA